MAITHINNPMPTQQMPTQTKCAFCSHLFDTDKLVWNSIISQYICLECRQSWLQRSDQRRREREQRDQERHQERLRQRQEQRQEQNN